MTHLPIKQRRRCRAFTLAEIIVAIVIFGMVMVAIGTVMRTAIRAWRTGHDLNEITQTARIAKDVILRDLNNMVFIRHNYYNFNFYNSLMQAAQLYSIDLEENGYIELDDRFDFDTVTPPIDLSFRIGSSGDHHTLSFVRSHLPRYEGDPNTWGLRRVNYFVRDNVLFRQEEDPFGYRPGQLDESFFNAPDAAVVLAERFMRQDDYAHLYPDGDVEALPEDQLMLPASVSLAEPLCEGVEEFTIIAGYFKDAQWFEAEDWDSSARRYRMPPRIVDIDERDLDNLSIRSPADIVMIDGLPVLIADRGHMDDLPGYIAIRMGVRGPRGVGRIHYFTFFHSLPLGEERDRLRLSEEEIEALENGYFPDVDLRTRQFPRQFGR